jgi:hypothetical protein
MLKSLVQLTVGCLVTLAGSSAGADAWPDRCWQGSLDACCGCRSAGLDPQAAGHLPADAKETVPCHMTKTPRAGAGSWVPTG